MNNPPDLVARMITEMFTTTFKLHRFTRLNAAFMQSSAPSCMIPVLFERGIDSQGKIKGIPCNDGLT